MAWLGWGLPLFHRVLVEGQLVMLSCWLVSKVHGGLIQRPTPRFGSLEGRWAQQGPPHKLLGFLKKAS